MTFLPQDYQEPKTQSRFPKFEEGTQRYRVVGDVVIGRQYFIGKEKFIVKNEEDVPMDKVNDHPEYGKSYSFFWAFPVWDYQTECVSILCLTQKTIRTAFKLQLEDKEFSDPTEYDIKITKGAKGEKPLYTFGVGKHGSLPEEIIEEMSKIEVHMDAYYNCETVENIFIDVA